MNVKRDWSLVRENNGPHLNPKKRTPPPLKCTTPQSLSGVRKDVGRVKAFSHETTKTKVAFFFWTLVLNIYVRHRGISIAQRALRKHGAPLRPERRLHSAWNTMSFRFSAEHAEHGATHLGTTFRNMPSTWFCILDGPLFNIVHNLCIKFDVEEYLFPESS